jgi:hypothetical protein
MSAGRWCIRSERILRPLIVEGCHQLSELKQVMHALIAVQVAPKLLRRSYRVRCFGRMVSQSCRKMRAELKEIRNQESNLSARPALLRLLMDVALYGNSLPWNVYVRDAPLDPETLERNHLGDPYHQA